MEYVVSTLLNFFHRMCYWKNCKNRIPSRIPFCVFFSFSHFESVQKSLLFSITGFHNRWNRQVAVRHPNLWIFVRHLKDEERHSRRTLHAANRGDAPPAAKRRYRQLQERIQRLTGDYRRGHRSLDEYWSAITHAMHEFQWLFSDKWFSSRSSVNDSWSVLYFRYFCINFLEYYS